MTEIINPVVRYTILLIVAYSVDQHAKNPHSPLASLYSFYASGVVIEYGWDDDDVDTALRELVGLGHVTQTENGCYVPTPDGIAWLDAESAVRQSSVDAQAMANDLRRGGE